MIRCDWCREEIAQEEEYLSVLKDTDEMGEKRGEVFYIHNRCLARILSHQKSYERKVEEWVRQRILPG